MGKSWIAARTPWVSISAAMASRPAIKSSIGSGDRGEEITGSRAVEKAQVRQEVWWKLQNAAFWPDFADLGTISRLSCAMGGTAGISAAIQGLEGVVTRRGAIYGNLEESIGAGGGGIVGGAGGRVQSKNKL